jgi:hypothetical protein
MGASRPSYVATVCLTGHYDKLALSMQENSSGYSVTADWKCLEVWCELITANI